MTGCKCVAGSALQVVQNTLYCVLCKPGQCAVAGANECLSCPNGMYAGGTCTPCPARSVARVGS